MCVCVRAYVCTRVWVSSFIILLACIHAVCNINNNKRLCRGAAGVVWGSSSRRRSGDSSRDQHCVQWPLKPPTDPLCVQQPWVSLASRHDALHNNNTVFFLCILNKNYTSCIIILYVCITRFYVRPISLRDTLYDTLESTKIKNEIFITAFVTEHLWNITPQSS